MTVNWTLRFTEDETSRVCELVDDNGAVLARAHAHRAPPDIGNDVLWRVTLAQTTLRTMNVLNYDREEPRL